MSGGAGRGERFRARSWDGNSDGTFFLRPVGVVRSSLLEPALAPRQGAIAGTEAEIEIFPPYAAGLLGVADRALPAGEASFAGVPPDSASGSAAPEYAFAKSGKILVLCWLDRADRDALSVHPFGNPANPLRGVFSTRSPHRPNPISLHTVELLGVRGNVLRVRGMDAVDGTPVLDIKPHASALDD